MSAGRRFPRAEAIAVAKVLCDALKPATDRLIVAGSLRRRKAEVGDVEIMFIPKMGEVPDGLFTAEGNMADAVLNGFLEDGCLRKRLNEMLRPIAWGPRSKSAVHAATGIAVDLFATVPERWFNLLVCRTGGAETNIAIATAARDRGLSWNVGGEGFTDAEGDVIKVASEEDVFRISGVPFKQPWERS